MRNTRNLKSHAFAVIFIGILLIPFQALASGAEARREYLAGNYQNALKIAASAAERGDSTAMMILGWLYYKGAGVQRDNGAAISWWQKAAQKGNPKAQNNLGMAYQNGTGVEKDYEQAVKWYRLAAKQNYGLAYSNLGVLHQYGNGVDQDYKKALEYFTKAEQLLSQSLLSDPENAKATKDDIEFVKARIWEVKGRASN